MTHWLSEPIESLLVAQDFPFNDSQAQQQFMLETDVLVVGSGYGAAMATLALLENTDPDTRTQLWVFEAGGEYVPEDFPATLSEMPGYVGLNEVNASALWDVRAGDGVMTISGRGLGGTSLVNANVAARVDASVLAEWPDNARIGWQARLSDYYPKIENLLGVTTLPAHHSSGSFTALQASAKALGADTAGAPLSINFDGPTRHSADHGACNRCGNCVIGCHSGAKGSLNMNAWPLAKQLGASLYTGVQVRSLSRDAQGRWLAVCVPSANRQEIITVRAGTVILAAGTLGSTEILQRSQQMHALGLSSRLGQRFSLNGDALVSAVGQRSRVSDMPSAPGLHPAPTQPGPTISGISRIALTDVDRPVTHAVKQSITLEDAQIPFPLRQIWQEMITTQALLRRFGSGALSAWHQQNSQHDALAISDELAAHTQNLLVMGHDDASGELVWEEGKLQPRWKRKPGDYYQILNERLQKNEREVFDGGLYSPNLISQILPPGFEDILEGAEDVPGYLLSVHPLGGCCLASSISEGVVNNRGQVFTHNTAEGIYDNLYVLDGAIIPGALGTNPFLTIATLSYALASDISLSNAQPGFSNLQDFPALTRFRTVPRGTRRPVSPVQAPVTAEFNERLVCHLQPAPRSRFPWSTERAICAAELRQLLPALPWPEHFNALVLDASLDFSGAQSLEKWIRNPSQDLPARARLSVDQAAAVFTTADDDLFTLCELSGSVSLGAADSAGSVRSALRTLGALARFARFRTIDGLVRLPSWLARWLLSRDAYRIREPELKKRSSKSLLAQAREFWRIAALQSAPRYLVYEFFGPDGLSLRGRKTLAYGINRRDLLAALLVLPVDVRSPSGRRRQLLFEMDTVRVTDGPSPLQVLSSPDLPASVMAAGGFALYFLRLIMNTHFWSFAAPAYRQFAGREQMETSIGQGRFAEPPEYIFFGAGGRQRSARKEQFENADSSGDLPRPLSRLVRYQPDGHGVTRRSLLLIHGLAHSSRVFWTDTIACNFVQYFLGQNYDVWVLDHRASANYIREIQPQDRWDDIALSDVPWAVKTAFEHINRDQQHKRQLHVFAHCIGAGAAAMAVLAGRLNHEHRLQDGSVQPRSMLASLVPHAVTPWLHASGENRARANVWAWVKELEPIKVIEPMPYREPEFLETIYDRLAALAMTEDERRQWSSLRGFADWRGPGFAQSIYTRYTIFWGRQWHNANINRATRYEFAGMIGPVPIGVMQQVYFSMTRGLLSNHEGANSYVREPLFASHWQFPTLFLHGNRNTVFDQESSRHSADQLTRLRIKQRSGQRHDEALQPEDYARHGVWIDVLDDYGHMDMIFSRHAARDVYPRLHSFFEAADNDDIPGLMQQRLASAQARQWFMQQCTSRSVKSFRLLRSGARPRSGPIISSPTRQPDGAASLRIWLEAEDFSVFAAEGVGVEAQEADGASVQLRHLAQAGRSAQSSGDHSELWRHEFWLHDLSIPARLDRPLSLYLKQPGGKKSDSDDGVQLQWHTLPWFKRSFVQPPVAQPPLSLLAGSCLYPGVPFDRKGAFAAFAGMRGHLQDDDTGQRRGVDGLILLGDQIYADATADLFDPKAHYERYRNPYRLVFNQPDVAYVLSHLPSWFVIDDHEYRDNWHGDAEAEDYLYARRMAGLYQMHQVEHWDVATPRLWYHFSCAGYPAFVFDTRTQRHRLGDAPSYLLDAAQLKAFERWLAEQHDSPLLILASGSPIGPVSRAIVAAPALARYDDSLLAFPRFLARVTDSLARLARGKKIVWLTGDPHLSCAVAIAMDTGDTRVNILQLCCSGLNSPLPFANAQAGDHDWQTALQLPLRQGDTQLTLTAEQTLLTDHPRHFVRIDIDPVSDFRVTVQACDVEGAALGQRFEWDWNREQTV